MVSATAMSRSARSRQAKGRGKACCANVLVSPKPGRAEELGGVGLGSDNGAGLGWVWRACLDSGGAAGLYSVIRLGGIVGSFWAWISGLDAFFLRFLSGSKFVWCHFSVGPKDLVRDQEAGGRSTRALFRGWAGQFFAEFASARTVRLQACKSCANSFVDSVVTLAPSFTFAPCCASNLTTFCAHSVTLSWSCRKTGSDRSPPVFAAQLCVWLQDGTGGATMVFAAEMFERSHVAGEQMVYWQWSGIAGVFGATGLRVRGLDVDFPNGSRPELLFDAAPIAVLYFLKEQTKTPR